MSGMYGLAKDYDKIKHTSDFPPDFYTNLKSTIFMSEMIKLDSTNITDDEYDSDDQDETINNKIFSLGKIIVKRAIEEYEDRAKSPIPNDIYEEYDLLTHQKNTKSDTILFWHVVGEDDEED